MSFHNGLRRLLTTLFVVLLIGIFVQAQLRLGSITFDYPPAQPLVNPTHLSKGLVSYRFCTSVGGVAFGAIAKADRGQTLSEISYDPGQPDGHRLKVTVSQPDGSKVVVRGGLYDWQLVPIARFAAGDEHSCFTLFGQLMDEAQTEAHRRQGHEIVNYHPAFADTLLGLRLFQGDVLILYEHSCDLPKDGDRYLLGAGEQEPDVEKNRASLRAVHRLLDSLGPAFQSYVICDWGVDVTFFSSPDTLEITGEPIWHCWKSRSNSEQAFQAAQNKGNAEATRILNLEFRRDANAMSREALNQKYTDTYQRARHAEVFDAVVSAELLQTMPKYSQALSQEIKNQNGVNPAVYAALVSTMRYSALFRAYREANQEGFQAFLDSVKGVTVSPAVKTPTVMVQH